MPYRIEFRDMRIEDIPQIEELEALSFTMRWREGSYMRELTNPLAYYVVAINASELLGVAGFWHIGDEGHIMTIAVRPELRRQGIGRRLTQLLLEEGHSRRIGEFTLEVRVSNIGAQRLYRELGFAVCGRRKAYYSDNGEDAFIMTKDLRLNGADFRH